MVNIHVRNLNDETHHTMRMIAGALGVSMNALCNSIFDEFAQPYSGLAAAVKDRITDAESNRDKVYRTVDVPAPQKVTREVKKEKR